MTQQTKKTSTFCIEEMREAMGGGARFEGAPNSCHRHVILSIFPFQVSLQLLEVHPLFRILFLEALSLLFAALISGTRKIIVDILAILMDSLI